jgi:head-tail adaptor
MTLRTRRLRERVTVEVKNLVDNGKGGRTRPEGEPEWKPVTAKPIAAEIIPLRGDEALSNAVLRKVQLYRVTIRHREGVSPVNRIRWGDVVMNIKSATRSIDRRSIVMTCEAGVAT